MSSSQSTVSRLRHSVREALVTSVACTRPPVSFHTSHASTVPNASARSSARRVASGTASSSQRIFVPEKYASSTRPVRCRTTASRPAAFSASHSGAVRRHCQTIARWTGRPVARSQTIVVSRWLVMPIAATSAPLAPAVASASRAAVTVVVQISSGSCSTQPGCG